MLAIWLHSPQGVRLRHVPLKKKKITETMCSVACLSYFTQSKTNVFMDDLIKTLSWQRDFNQSSLYLKRMTSVCWSHFGFSEDSLEQKEVKCKECSFNSQRYTQAPKCFHKATVSNTNTYECIISHTFIHLWHHISSTHHKLTCDRCICSERIAFVIKD